MFSKIKVFLKRSSFLVKLVSEYRLFLINFPRDYDSFLRLIRGTKSQFFQGYYFYKRLGCDDIFVKKSYECKN